MAQKYNPSTGQWEDDEEDSSSLGGGLANAFGGSAPAMDGSSMAAGVPQFASGSFSNPQYSLSNLPSGYSWGDDDYLTSQGISKKYANPWDTKYSYMKGDQELGFGYDDYQTAIQKLAAKGGITKYDEGYGHKAFYTPGSSGGGEQGDWSIPESRGKMFATEQEVFDYMMNDPTARERITYDSREKYGRPLIEGQLQNMYANYATGNFTGAVPDWTYHRAAYDPNQPTSGLNVTGDAALVGSIPLFGSDGRILGYKSNLNPDHLRLADTSGRVTSSTYGGTTVDPEVQKILHGIDDNYAFINPGDVDKFGYRSYGSSSYNKEDSAFGGLMKKLVPAAILAVGGAGLAGMFGPAGAAAGAGEAALGLGAADLSSLASVSPWAADAAAGLSGIELASGAAAGGSGLELLGDAGGYGFTSPEIAGQFPEILGGDLGSFFDITGINGLDPSAFSTESFINGLDPSAFGINQTPVNTLDFGGSQTMSPTAEALGSFPQELMGPPPASEMEGLFLDDWGGGTNSLGEFTNAKGMRSLQDIGANTLRDLGIPRETAANLSQGAGKMYNFMNQSPGKAGMFKAPSPLEMLYKGGKAFMDYRSNKDAMGMYEDQLDKVRAYQDPNRARGDFANQAWQQNFQNPMAGYKDFMMGGGREFIDQARAQAAKSGRRGSYINSGKMNSDLASLYMKNQLQRGDTLARGFERGVNSEENAMRYMAPLMEMKRNEYAPFGQAIDSIMRGFQLSDLFGG